MEKTNNNMKRENKGIAGRALEISKKTLYKGKNLIKKTAYATGRAIKKGVKPYAKELASTAVLTGVYAYALSGTPALKHAREAVYYARHAGNTVGEMVSGTQGQKGLRNLEKALEIVNLAAENNKEAKSALEEYISRRKDFARELAAVYKQNETLSNESKRLLIQLQGTLVNFFQIGNDIKNDTWKKIDEQIVKIYGMDPVEAKERSERLRGFYDEVRKFYDSRERNENTVRNFCDYLAKFIERTNNENESITKLFPEVVGAVKEGYEVEDAIFRSGKRNIFGMKRDVSSREISEIRGKTDSFGKTAKRTEDNVISEVPEIKPYSTWDWKTLAMSPFGVGAILAVGTKGASRLIPGGSKVLTFTTLSPFYLGGAIYKRVRKDNLNNQGHKEDLNIREDYSI